MRNELLAAGYHEFDYDPTHKDAVGCFQKAILGETGKRYFINVYEYRVGGGRHHVNSFIAEAQFENENSYFDVMLHEFASVDELEDFYRKIWELGCIPYDK